MTLISITYVTRNKYLIALNLSDGTVGRKLQRNTKVYPIGYS